MIALPINACRSLIYNVSIVENDYCDDAYRVVGFQSNTETESPGDYETVHCDSEQIPAPKTVPLETVVRVPGLPLPEAGLDLHELWVRFTGAAGQAP